MQLDLRVGHAEACRDGVSLNSERSSIFPRVNRSRRPCERIRWVMRPREHRGLQIYYMIRRPHDKSVFHSSIFTSYRPPILRRTNMPVPKAIIEQLKQLIPPLNGTLHKGQSGQSLITYHFQCIRSYYLIDCGGGTKVVWACWVVHKSEHKSQK